MAQPGTFEGGCLCGALRYTAAKLIDAGYARYRTPVAGLYLCGAGSHPGGGVTGIPGRNAAREILKDG